MVEHILKYLHSPYNKLEVAMPQSFLNNPLNPPEPPKEEDIKEEITEGCDGMEKQKKW